MARVVDSGRFILGEEVEAFERELAAYCGARHGIGCASGTDALLLALVALNPQPGDQVLTVPYTFFATAGSILHAGFQPVFADVEADTFNLDVAAAERVLDRHPRIRAILPVHLYGACADMDVILDLARARGIAVIEDAAQAIGAEYRHRRAGSMGLAGCFSFFPTKNLGAFGDGGMITTDDDALAARLRLLRVHGSSRRYYYEVAGYASRLDALQAAVLRVKLRRLDEWTAGRQRNAASYTHLLQASGAPVILPGAKPYQTRHIFNQYVIRCPRRDDLRGYLERQGIGTEIYYPLPLHLQPCFEGLGLGPGAFPVSERLAAESLALPIFPELASEDIQWVVDRIAAFYEEYGG